MDLALCIFADGAVLVAAMLVIKCPPDKIVELAEAFAQSIGGAPKPSVLPASPALIKVELTAADQEQGQIEPPAA